MQPEFKIAIRCGYAEKYIERCIESILSQKYTNWRCQIVFDPVDSSYNKALKYKDKIGLHVNNSGVCHNNINNWRHAIYLLCCPENISNYKGYNFLLGAEMETDLTDKYVIVLLDADDWFKDENSLGIVAKYYQDNPDLLLTHGSYETYPLGLKTLNRPYTRLDFKRGIRKTRWKASHLRTFKYKLFKQIKPESLRDPSGNYLDSIPDLALMFPMLEMAGYDRIKYIPEIVYVYNRENQFNYDKIFKRKQKQDEMILRSMEPYGRIQF